MWRDELETAREAASLAGDILADMRDRTHLIRKKGAIDLVTEADLRSEEAILDLLGRRFPGDAFLAEESPTQSGSTGRTWIVDPLDGTVNYAHGFPFYAVSIALEAGEEVVVGVIRNPLSGEQYEAVTGEGAFLNGTRLSVSSTRRLNDALLATGFPYDIRESPDRVLRLFNTLILRARGLRRAGSAALDLCMVAAGRADGFWEEKLHPWDTAAGVLLVREAGGVVTSFRGSPFRLEDRTIVAGNPAIHRSLIEVISSETEPRSPS